jgi:hypothetical protein
MEIDVVRGWAMGSRVRKISATSEFDMARKFDFFSSNCQLGLAEILRFGRSLFALLLLHTGYTFENVEIDSIGGSTQI